MVKFTTCFPMVGGCLGTLASSTTKTGRLDLTHSQRVVLIPLGCKVLFLIF